MMYRRENIDRKIVDLRRLLATTDDQLVIVLLNMAIESFIAERESLLAAAGQSAAEEGRFSNDNVGVAATKPP